MKRSEQRETIFRLLFMSQFRGGEEMPELITTYLDGVRGGLEEVPADGNVSAEEERVIDLLKQIAEENIHPEF